MPEDASALLDLGAILVWAVAFALATLAYYLARAVAAPFDISIPGLGKPFHGVAVAIENAIIEPMNDVRQASEAGIAKGVSGLLASLELIVGLTLLLGDGVKLALQYLWNHALGPFVHSITDKIATDARQALAKIDGVETTITHDIAAATATIEAQAVKEIAAAGTALRAEIQSAKAEALAYADDAVAKLRAAEDAALARAAAIASAAAASADAAAQTALADVRGISIPINVPLPSLDELAGLAGAGALIASIPALATLVQALAVDTGLENESCRTKVKGICGTDPSAWAGLLAGIAEIGVGFSLADLATFAETITGDVAGLLEQAA